VGCRFQRATLAWLDQVQATCLGQLYDSSSVIEYPDVRPNWNTHGSATDDGKYSAASSCGQRVESSFATIGYGANLYKGACCSESARDGIGSFWSR